MERQQTLAIWVHFHEAYEAAIDSNTKALVLAIRALAELQHAQVNDLVKALGDVAHALRGHK
jgi:hypothetical protein